MTTKQLVVIGGLAALAVFLYVGRATYPRWGMYLHQSPGRQ
jgi:hypothetical protein